MKITKITRVRHGGKKLVFRPGVVLSDADARAYGLLGKATAKKAVGTKTTKPEVAQPPKLEEMKRPQLLARAAELGLEFPRVGKNADAVKAIKAKEKELAAAE